MKCFLQDQLQNFLLHGDPAIQDHVMGTANVSVETRLAIYQNAYRLRLIDSLATTYPMLNRYLGDDVFADICNDYIAEYPSIFRSIRWFGDQLPAFLIKHPDCSAYPVLAELAQFEWMMTIAFDAADADCLQLEDIAGIPADAWETMRFQAHPSASLLSLRWNAISIWQALSDETTPEEPEESPSPITWIVWRTDLLCQFCSLTECEAWAINAMLKGASFGDLCEGMCQWIDEENAALHAASLLKGWITAELISKVIN